MSNRLILYFKADYKIFPRIRFYISYRYNINDKSQIKFLHLMFPVDLRLSKALDIKFKSGSQVLLLLLVWSVFIILLFISRIYLTFCHVFSIFFSY